MSTYFDRISRILAAREIEIQSASFQRIINKSRKRTTCPDANDLMDDAETAMSIIGDSLLSCELDKACCQCDKLLELVIDAKNLAEILRLNKRLSAMRVIDKADAVIRELRKAIRLEADRALVEATT